MKVKQLLGKAVPLPVAWYEINLTELISECPFTKSPKTHITQSNKPAL